MAVPAEMMALTEEQLEEIEQMESKRLARLDEIGLVFESEKDEAVRAANEFHKRLSEDRDQYNGRPIGSRATKEFSAEEPDYRRARDNITKVKVHMMASRLIDLAYPTNEINWDLQHSPIPELVNQDAVAIDPQTGQQIPASALRTKKLAAATKSALRMRQTVEDQFNECSFDAEARDGMFDMALHGTVVMKGPFVQTVKRQVWQQRGQLSEMVTSYVEKPSAKRVPLDAFFPQPCRNIKEAEHAFELHMMTRKKLRSLAKQPGFHKEQIKKLLDMEPDMGVLKAALTTRSDGDVGSMGSVYSDRYAVFERHGPVPKDAMVAFLESMMGCCDESEGIAELVEELNENPLNVIYSEVWFCQGVVVKAVPTGLDDDDDLIYRVATMEKDPDHWAGYGVAYWLRDDQISRDALWQAMLLNTFMSSGPQIGIRKGALHAEAGKKQDYSCVGPKVWVLGEDIDNINQAMGVFTVPNTLAGIIPVYEQVGRNADERSLMPLVMQGDASRATPTSSGTAMMMNQANIGIASILRGLDDDITAPLVNGFVDWNMRFNPDPDIKGDFEVLPKTASYLLVKDIKIQNMQVAIQMLGQMPEAARKVKMDDLVLEMLSMLNIDLDKFKKSDEEIQAEAEQGGQPDPDTIKAQAAMANAEANSKRADAAVAKAQAEAQTTQQKMMIDDQHFQAKLQDADRERQFKLMIQRILFEIEQMRMAQEGEIAADEMINNKEMVQLENQLKQMQTMIDARLEAARVAQGSKKLDAQLRYERPFRTE